MKDFLLTSRKDYIASTGYNYCSIFFISLDVSYAIRFLLSGADSLVTDDERDKIDNEVQELIQEYSEHIKRVQKSHVPGTGTYVTQNFGNTHVYRGVC